MREEKKAMTIKRSVKKNYVIYLHTELQKKECWLNYEETLN